MRLFELAQELKVKPSNKKLKDFLREIGNPVKGENGEVSPWAYERVKKELAPILAQEEAERKQKEKERHKRESERRAQKRKEEQALRKQEETEEKKRKAEEEKRLREEAKRKAAEEKAAAKARAAEEKKRTSTTKKKAKAAITEGGEGVTALAEIAPPSVEAQPAVAVPPAVEQPTIQEAAVAAEAPPATETVAEEQPSIAPTPPSPPAAPESAAPAEPAKESAPSTTTDTVTSVPPTPPTPAAPSQRPVGPPPPPVGVSREAYASQTAVRPPVLPRRVVSAPASAPSPTPSGGAATAAPTAPAAPKPKTPPPPPPPPVGVARKDATTDKLTKPSSAPEAKPLEREKKSALASDVINSIMDAQRSTVSRRREEEEEEEDRPKRKKPQFLGVEDRDELINRPRVSASAVLRQLLAERTQPVSVPGLRKLRKMRHGSSAPRPPAPSGPREIVITPPITVRDFSQATGLKVADVIAKLMRLNVMASINQLLDRETIELFAVEYNLPITIQEEEESLEEHAFAELPEEVPPEKLAPRPPVVTFMGHVDHGKTSLLDAIRKTNVAAGEAGGITQHIGASQVTTPHGTITFIDTPGHEAFTAMRARGAKVTDIAVLVVAADDGLMPQSLEAIDHARAAKVPIMVAINKIDLPTANPDRVLAQLAERGLTPEAWGGDTICVNVSALTRQGIDKLLEMILLQAELLELRARSDGPAKGVVLEAVLDPHRGPLVTLLVQEGRLKRGDAIVSGTSFARARTLLNHRQEPVESAGPSDPVLVLGFDSVPPAGSEFRVATSEKHARELVEQRREEERLKKHAETQKVTLETFRLRMANEQVKELRLIIKGDTQGTTEALRGAVERLSSGDAKVTVLHSGVGAVTDNDVTLASASDAVIIAFRVDVQESARALAKSEGVDIKSYEVIYHATEEIERALQGLLEPKFKEVEMGVAEVRAIFKLSVGTVAGCHVLSGVVQRGNRVRVLRGGQQVFDGEIQSLKHLKDEVREIRAGFDCGILLRGFSDVQEGDRIHAYKLERESLSNT